MNILKDPKFKELLGKAIAEEAREMDKIRRAVSYTKWNFHIVFEEINLIYFKIIKFFHFSIFDCELLR